MFRYCLLGWLALADLARQRVAFMQKLPPCTALVSYQPSLLICEGAHSEFIFEANDVEAFVTKVKEEQPHLIGMNGLMLWLSRRDHCNTQVTQIPELIINFETVAHDLISSKLGQVKCKVCNKTFAVHELSNKKMWVGGWGVDSFECPISHPLFMYEVMHVMFKKNYT